jgi:hypothetical protein
MSAPDNAAKAVRGDIDPLRAQHLELGRRQIRDDSGICDVTVDEAESPLAWLARRKGRDGRALIEPVQLLAGERLRAEFTRAHLMPRITSNWSAAVASGARGASPASFTEAVIGARQRVRAALDVVGPEFSGLLVDVCCFLKRLEQVETERSWPPRSAKVAAAWARPAGPALRPARQGQRHGAGCGAHLARGGCGVCGERRRSGVISSPPRAPCWRRGGCGRPWSGSHWSAAE